MKYLLSLVCLIVSVSSPVFAQDSPQALQDAFMAALKANSAPGLAALYTDDAVNFPVGDLIGIGPQSVAASWGGFFTAYKVVDASLAENHMEIHGDTAIAWGLFTIMAEPVAGGETVEMVGRYMDIARYIDGNWRYVADHASMPVPAE